MPSCSSGRAGRARPRSPGSWPRPSTAPNLQDGDACDACPSCVSIREGTTLDLIEIDAASNRGIDDVRNLRERLPYPPGQLRRKVYILDEAHQITKDAWNALLKSIEEPPDFVIFMFASTEPSLFPPAILSRLQRYDVRRLTVAEIEGKLTRILTADGREADPAAIHLIARLAAGGMRDAESMLDQLLSAAPDRIDESHVRDLLGLADAEVVEAFIDHLVRGDGAAGVALLDSLEERGRDIRALLDQAVEAIRAELIAGLGDPASRPTRSCRPRRRRPSPGRDRPQPGRDRRAALPARARDVRHLADVGGTPVPSVAARPAVRLRRRHRRPPRLRRRHPAAAAPAPTPAAASAPAPAPSTPSPSSTQARTPTPDAGPAPDSRPRRPAPTPPAAPPDARARRRARRRPPNRRHRAAAPNPAASDGSLDQLLAAWPAIVERLSSHPPTRPLIVACRPVAVDGAIVTLGFPEEQAFLKDQAERRKPGIEAGIAEVIGHPVTVHCVVANVELPPAASDDLVAEARRIFAEELADVGEVS